MSIIQIMQFLKLIGIGVVGILGFNLLKKNGSPENIEVSNPDILEPNNETENTNFYPMVQPLELRNDPLGHGHFGASRGGGIRKHNGIDLVVFNGQKIYSPIDGIMVRYANPYTNDPIYKGLLIKGTGSFDGLSIKVFYLNPMVFPSEIVFAGQTIGIAQKISEKWGVRMKDHIHIEIRKNGQLIDPVDFIFPTA